MVSEGLKLFRHILVTCFKGINVRKILERICCARPSIDHPKLCILEGHQKSNKGHFMHVTNGHEEK